MGGDNFLRFGAGSSVIWVFNTLVQTFDEPTFTLAPAKEELSKNLRFLVAVQPRLPLLP